ncbi:hypothetical protein [Maricaulis sp. MIT060901]|uniref:hypothetical protein n=1 Tax=Maricaulis sp. MIT060901 TaxID=3096993 RepID=UPI00399C491D
MFGVLGMALAVGLFSGDPVHGDLCRPRIAPDPLVTETIAADALQTPYAREVLDVILRPHPEDLRQSVLELEHALAQPAFGAYELNARTRALAYVYLGGAYYNLDRQDASLDYWERAVSTRMLFPDEAASVHFNLAQLYIRASNVRDTIIHLRATACLTDAETELPDQFADVVGHASLMEVVHPTLLAWREQLGLIAARQRPNSPPNHHN